MTELWYFPTLCLLVATALLVLVAGLLSLERRSTLGGLIITLLIFGACVSYATSVLNGPVIYSAADIQCLGAPYEVC